MNVKKRKVAHVTPKKKENHKKFRTFEGGSSVSLTMDGRLLAKNGNGIEIYDLASGQLIRKIEKAREEDG